MVSDESNPGSFSQTFCLQHHPSCWSFSLAFSLSPFLSLHFSLSLSLTHTYLCTNTCMYTCDTQSRHRLREENLGMWPVGPPSKVSLRPWTEMKRLCRVSWEHRVETIDQYRLQEGVHKSLNFVSEYEVIACDTSNINKNIKGVTAPSVLLRVCLWNCPRDVSSLLLIV